MPLGKALWSVHSPLFLKWLVIKLANDFNQTLPAILLNQILTFLADDDAAMSEGVLLVLAAFLLMMIKTFVENCFFFQIIRISIQVKVSIIGAVYRKALRLTPAAKALHTEGEILNLMQQDSERLQWFTGGVPAMMLSGMLQIVLNSCLLFYFIGISSVVGILMLFALIPVNRVLVGMQMKLRFATQKHVDERIKVTNELLKGIRVVKTYAW